MPKNRFQKKLDIEPDPEYGDLNEYELSFIPTPEPGPYTVEDMYLEGFDLDFFSEKRIQNATKSFQKAVIPKIGVLKYEAIERSLNSYTSSAARKTDDLLYLKKVIIDREPVLKSHLSKGHKLLYLERHTDGILSVDPNAVPYTITDFNIYRKEAEKVTTRVLKSYVKWLTKKDELNPKFADVESISVYRGFNNLFYYKKKRNNVSDFLSLYASASHNEPYYEPNILNSYSLCHLVAEKFMVAKQSERRVFINTSFEELQTRVVSSFINSPVFKKNQFEILTLPNVTPLTIRQDMNDEELYASFTIN